MNTTAKYRIETLLQHPTYWETCGMDGPEKFDSAAEARCAVRALKTIDESWAEAEYRIVGPQGIESAEMDAEAWRYAIDCQLASLGLSDPDLGRSAMVCRIDDAGAVLADVDDWNKPMDPGELCAILESIDAAQHLDDIREELAAELQAQ